MGYGVGLVGLGLGRGWGWGHRVRTIGRGFGLQAEIKHTAAWVDEIEQALGGSEGLARGLQAEVNGEQATCRLR